MNLVVQTAFLGDLLLSIPLLKAIKRKFPEQRLGVVARKGIGQPLLTLGLIDELYEIEKGNRNSYHDIRDKLKHEEIEVVVCPHQSFRTGLFIFSLKAKLKIGFDQLWTRWVYNKVVKRPMQYPEAIRQLSLLVNIDDQVEALFSELNSEKLFFNENSEEDIRQGKAIPTLASMSLGEEIDRQPSLDFGLEREYVCIAPGSVWPTKRWHIDGYIQLAKMISGKGKQIVLLGSPAEYDICHLIEVQVDNSVNLTKTTSIVETMKVLRGSQGLITNDSGAQHMAAVAGCKLISIFGPTTLSLGYRPWTANSRVVQVDLDCRPCGTHGGHRCPLGTHDCMKKISAKHVLEAFNSI